MTLVLLWLLCSAFMAFVAWHESRPTLATLVICGPAAVFVIAVYYLACWLDEYFGGDSDGDVL